MNRFSNKDIAHIYICLGCILRTQNCRVYYPFLLAAAAGVYICMLFIHLVHRFAADYILLSKLVYLYY